MSQEMWKFPVTLEPFTHEIPADARFLSCQWQHNALQMWWLVDPSNPKKRRRFRVFGTGHHIPPDHLGFLATFQVANGEFVFHLFEVR